MKKAPTMAAIMAVITILQVVNGLLQGSLDETAVSGAISAVGALFAIWHHTTQVQVALDTPVPDVPEAPEDIDLPQPSDAELGD